MNSLSCGELCTLFCCPPCPGRIAAKLAFMPPDPSYAVSVDQSGNSYQLHLSEKAEFVYSQKELNCLEVFKARSKKGNSICLMYVHCNPTSRYVLLYSHGNAVDLGQMSSFFIGLGMRLKCDVLSYDYSGYGVSEGKPSESNIYSDMDCAFQTLRTRYARSPDSIVLYGQSIGTVPTVDLAARYEVAGVILHSPLTSGIRVACPETRRTYCFDSFPSIDKAHRIASPVLVIHGTEDDVIDFTHGMAIYDRCPITVEPLWVEGAGHNDVELYSQYLSRIKRFLDRELPERQSAAAASATTASGSQQPPPTGGSGGGS